MKTRTTKIFRAALLAATLTAAVPAALAGDCYTAEVGHPIVLPDGTVSDDGQVRVCRIKQLTPASTLHSLSIGGRDLGMFLGARQTVELDERTPIRPSMVFEDTGAGALEFRAVVYTVDGRFEAFRADRIGRDDRAVTRNAYEMALAGLSGSRLVAVAAD